MSKMSLTIFSRSIRTRHIFILVPLIWLFVMIVLFTVGTVFQKPSNELNINNNNNNNEHEIQLSKLNYKLNEANHQIDVLMEQNRQLAKSLKEFTLFKKKKDLIYAKLSQENANPTTGYESSRRRVRQNVNELWYYLRTKLNTSSMQFVNEMRYLMLNDLDILEKRDRRWRKKELRSLSDFVQRKIEVMQNPIDCKSAKKLVCDLNKSCGFGCQMHHSAHCLVAAMALNRTLIMKTDTWRTSDPSNNVWNKVFQPFSQTCLDPSGHNQTNWYNYRNNDSYQVIYYPIIDYIEPRPYFLPLVIPEQISNKLIELSGEPFIWFIGQVLKYIMRPSDKMNAYINEFKKRNQFSHPIVGVHVRRTDKIGSEAQFHSIDEYMHFVDDFYNKLDLENERNKKADRLVYLATDEPDVWTTEITKYKEKGYLFKGDVRLSESADPSLRHGFESLRNVIVDILLLSQCDYIVCTFSSQICRLAFELMQTQHSETDLSNAFYSLDEIYYFGGQVFHGKLAIMNHKAQNVNEINFKVGDVLGIASNTHNGYNFGDNNQTKAKGYYPRFKVTEYIESKPFAIFG